MTSWLGQIGADKLEVLVAQTLRIAIETRAMPLRDSGRATMDVGPNQGGRPSYQKPPTDAWYQMVEPACSQARVQVAAAIPARRTPSSARCLAVDPRPGAQAGHAQAAHLAGVARP